MVEVLMHKSRLNRRTRFWVSKMTEHFADWTAKTGSVVFALRWGKGHRSHRSWLCPYNSESQAHAADFAIPSVSLDLLFFFFPPPPPQKTWIRRKASHLAGSGRCDISHGHTSESFFSFALHWALLIIRTSLRSAVVLIYLSFVSEILISSFCAFRHWWPLRVTSMLHSLARANPI